MKTPTHGFTRHGLAVHGRTVDHHPNGTAYQRFNKKVALLIANNVGTMTCCWIFLLIAACSLPATLVLAHVVKGSVFEIAGLYVASAGLVLLVTWVAQSFLQLVLLPALMVGQNLQNEANDARASKSFEDLEWVKDQVNEKTEGGITTILEAITRLESALPDLRDSESQEVAAQDSASAERPALTLVQTDPPPDGAEHR